MQVFWARDHTQLENQHQFLKLYDNSVHLIVFYKLRVVGVENARYNYFGHRDRVTRNMQLYESTVLLSETRKVEMLTTARTTVLVF